MSYEQEYKPRSSCPECGRCPPIRFSRDEVRRAKRERQSARVLSVQCPRCRNRWWIRAGEIARAYMVRGSLIPSEFPGREHLVRAGISSLQGVLDRRGTLTEIPGIGPATASRIEEALDAIAQPVVA